MSHRASKTFYTKPKQYSTLVAAAPTFPIFQDPGKNRLLPSMRLCPLIVPALVVLPTVLPIVLPAVLPTVLLDVVLAVLLALVLAVLLALVLWFVPHNSFAPQL